MATFTEMLKNPRIDQIRLDGGILCFDFVNTVPDRVDGTNRDNLKNYEDLIYWAKKSENSRQRIFCCTGESGRGE
jgi:hypothetical protein